MRGTLSFALWDSGTRYAEKQTQKGLPLRSIPQILWDLEQSDESYSLSTRAEPGCGGLGAGGLNVQTER